MWDNRSENICADVAALCNSSFESHYVAHKEKADRRANWLNVKRKADSWTVKRNRHAANFVHDLLIITQKKNQSVKYARGLGQVFSCRLSSGYQIFRLL